MRAADNMAAGMAEEEARADALRRFGDVKRIKNLCREIEEGSVARKWLRASLWPVVVCGAALWANREVGQVNVLGEMLVITAALCRLLLLTRAERFGKQVSEPGGESIALESGPIRRRAGSRQHSLEAGRVSGHNYTRVERRRNFAALSAVSASLCAASLCVVVFTASARALSAHIRQAQAAASPASQTTPEKFAGTWTATIADMFKDAPVPPPLRDLPSDLLVAEVTLKAEGEKLTGTRVLYSYTKAADGSPVVAEKGEVELIDIKFDGQVLSGGVRTPDGDKLPGGWEMRLVDENKAEVRLTGDDLPEQQRKASVILHRTHK